MYKINLKSNYGFNLLELMLTITIAGILAAFALPEMNFALANSKIKSAASDAHISFLLARSEAIKRNGDITVDTISGGADWTSGWRVRTGTTTIKEISGLSNNLSIACSGTCPSTITFSKLGRASPSSELRFYMTDESRIFPRCLTLSLSGKPRIEVDNDHNYANGCG